MNAPLGFWRNNSPTVSRKRRLLGICDKGVEDPQLLLGIITMALAGGFFLKETLTPIGCTGMLLI
jgi:hypothetical protein